MKYCATSSTQNVESKSVLFGRKHNKFCKDLETVLLGQKLSTEVAVLLLFCTELYFTSDKVQPCGEAETNSSRPFAVCAGGFDRGVKTDSEVWQRALVPCSEMCGTWGDCTIPGEGLCTSASFCFKELARTGLC